MSLREASFSASRWTTASTVFRTLLQVAQIAVLARLLSPADFGLLAMAAAALTIVRMLVDLGISSALVHFPRPAASTLSTLYWLNLAASLVFMSVFAALAWPMAAIYERPELIPVVVLMSLALPIGACGQQFRVLAEKELQFSTIAVIEAIAALGGFIAAIAIARLGGGVYALVAGMLVTAGISSALSWSLLSSGLRPGFMFRLHQVIPYLRYGMYRMGDTLFTSIHGQADVLIGGAYVGSFAMGVYTVPRDQALLLANAIVNPVVTRVGFPVMAKIQDDRPRLRTIYLAIVRMTASINFPIYLALSVWADEVVAILLGSQWQDAGYFLRLFAIWGLIRSVGNPVGSLLYATGRVRRAFWWNIVLLILLPPALLLGAHLDGIRGLAWAMLSIQIVLFFAMYRWLVRAACGAEFREYVVQLAPALIASVLAVLPVAALLSLVTPANPWLRVIVGTAAAAMIYVVLSRWLNRQWFDAMLELVGGGRRRRSENSTD